MARRRFFVEEVHHGQAELTGEAAHHLRNVLRVEAGQKYEISDNERVYLAEVSLAAKKRVVFDVVENLVAVPPPARVHLYLALMKFDRFELAVEKATELGVERIVPVIAKRSEKGLEKAVVKRLARWTKIAHEASQQSRRVRQPEISEAIPFSGVGDAQAAQRYFLDEADGASLLPDMLHHHPGDEAAALLVGPEGGWVETERETARDAGWRPVSLGPQVLRTETAAIASLAVVMAHWAGRPGTEADR